MLTRAHAIADIDFRNLRIKADQLWRRADAGYLVLAESMVDVYRNGVGKHRATLHREVESLFHGLDCPPRRIQGFCKLLDDASKYARADARRVAGLRQKVFTAAANLHPLVTYPDRLFETQADAAKEQIADQLGMSWETLREALYADVPDFHRLERFDGFKSPDKLLRAYNIAQMQALLYDATEMRVWVKSDYKTIVRYAKLAGLMHEIERADEGFNFTFTGPASILRESRRYGVCMATLLPAVLACEDWKIEADIRRSQRIPILKFMLTAEDKFRSDRELLPDYDSSVEEVFARKWGEDRREGWVLERESEILSKGQKVFIPDFTFTHTDGRQVLLEIVGFWTPEYIAAKRATLAAFAEKKIILAVQKGQVAALQGHGLPTITYQSGLKIAPVLELLQSLQFSGR